MSSPHFARTAAFIALAASVVTGHALAAGNPANGKTLYQSNCLRCHAAVAMVPGANTAAGLSAAINSVPRMNALQGVLSTQDVADIAAYVANPGAATTSTTPTTSTTNGTVSSVKVPTPSGYGSGTVYYPSAGSNFGIVVVAPGFVEGEGAINWWGTRLAQSGFVVVTMGTKTLFDLPDARAKQMMAALKQVIGLAPSGPYSGKIDSSRQAVMGHSMGGGGTLIAARDNPSLKAAIPLAPWNASAALGTVTVPTLIMACQSDIIAPVKSHAAKFFAALPATTPHAYLEMAGASHFCTNSTASAAIKEVTGSMAEAWLKYYVNGDTSVSGVLQPATVPAGVSVYTPPGL
jgi:dienelactone hydrolase/cytochrome c553